MTMDSKTLSSTVNKEDKIPHLKEGSSSLNSSSSSDDEHIIPTKKKRGATRRGLAKRLALKKDEAENANDNKDENIYTSSLFDPETWSTDYRKAELQVKLAADSDIEEDVSSIFTKKKSSPNHQNNTKKTKKKTKSKVELDSNQNSEPFLIESDEEEIEELVQNNSVRRSPTPPPSQDNPRKKKNIKKMKGIKKTMKGLTRASERFIASEEKLSDVSIVEVSLSPDVTCKHIMIKVRSRSGIQRFPMKQNERFEQVFKDMASHEGVKQEQVVMYFEDHTIRPYDSPGSLNITVADIIDCHIRRPEECEHDSLYSHEALYPVDDRDVISLTVQGKNPKTRMVLRMRNHETMEGLMQRFSTKVEVPLSSLTFHFDGEPIRENDIASELELEDGFTIDVKGV